MATFFLFLWTISSNTESYRSGLDILLLCKAEGLMAAIVHFWPWTSARRRGRRSRRQLWPFVVAFLAVMIPRASTALTLDKSMMMWRWKRVLAIAYFTVHFLTDPPTDLEGGHQQMMGFLYSPQWSLAYTVEFNGMNFFSGMSQKKWLRKVFWNDATQRWQEPKWLWWS